LADAVRFEVNHAHDHSAAQCEGKVLKAPPGMNCPHGVTGRMGDDAKAPTSPAAATSFGLVYQGLRRLG